ncbi:MAG: DUF411 domain-containing protein [Sulfurifustaceae bacterium]
MKDVNVFKNGVPVELKGCHTAIVGGYVVEDHVPANDIRRLLKERPTVRGIAVPGMEGHHKTKLRSTYVRYR